LRADGIDDGSLDDDDSALLDEPSKADVRLATLGDGGNAWDVAITAAPSKCPAVLDVDSRGGGHAGDSTTSPAGHALEDALRRELPTGSKVRLFSASVERPLLRVWFATGIPKRKTLVNVHSFPPERNAWKDEQANRADLVVLDSHGHPWHRVLVTALQARGFTAVLLAGHPITNDIDREARDAGIPLVSLLEFNESLSTTRLSQLCGAIAEELVTRDG
jgi:hypothetical protein